MTHSSSITPPLIVSFNPPSFTRTGLFPFGPTHTFGVGSEGLADQAGDVGVALALALDEIIDADHGASAAVETPYRLNE